jgi:hypothetical protein
VTRDTARGSTLLDVRIRFRVLCSDQMARPALGLAELSSKFTRLSVVVIPPVHAEGVAGRSGRRDKDCSYMNTKSAGRTALELTLLLVWLGFLVGLARR